jgi:small subunit ribosomal protein S6
MRAYELLIVLKPDLEEEANNAMIEKFAGLIQQNQGNVEQITRWGKKRLAYEVKDFREGFYTLVLFQGVSETANELDRVLRLTDEVLRHIIVRRDAA